MTPEIADPIGAEAMALGSGIVLAIGDAGNDRIGMELGDSLGLNFANYILE